MNNNVREDQLVASIFSKIIYANYLNSFIPYMEKAKFVKYSYDILKCFK